MFRRFAIAALSVLGASLCATQANAQTATVLVPFTGSISSTCTFSNTVAGTLNRINDSEALSTVDVGSPGTTTLSCNADSTLTISNPEPISTPSGTPSTIQGASVQRTGTASYACSPSAGILLVSGCAGSNANGLPIPGNGPNEYQVHMTVISSGSAILPGGIYTYGVTLTAATP